VGTDEELPDSSVITCDNVVTLPKAMFVEYPVVHLGLEQRAALDQALRYSLAGCREKPGRAS
jgi:mRNA-degrading endonuclease toxin of MazEF toxin-antitoxin module